MQTKIKIEYGFINIENDVIARLAGIAVMECAGVVGMAAMNMRDGIVQLLKRESLVRGVKVENTEDALIISLHVIVEYGININAIANTLQGNVKYALEETTGISINEVNIYVEGIRVE